MPQQPTNPTKRRENARRRLQDLLERAATDAPVTTAIFLRAVESVYSEIDTSEQQILASLDERLANIERLAAERLKQEIRFWGTIASLGESVAGFTKNAVTRTIGQIALLMFFLSRLGIPVNLELLQRVTTFVLQSSGIPVGIVPTNAPIGSSMPTDLPTSSDAEHLTQPGEPADDAAPPNDAVPP